MAAAHVDFGILHDILSYHSATFESSVSADAISVLGGRHESIVWTKANRDRRSFIGGSDARIVMGEANFSYRTSGGKSVAKSNRRTYPATSSSNLGS